MDSKDKNESKPDSEVISGKSKSAALSNGQKTNIRHVLYKSNRSLLLLFCYYILNSGGENDVMYIVHGKRTKKKMTRI